MNAIRPAAFVATLGTQPQVVTVALDLLLDDRVPIEEVLVIHTASSRPRPGTPPPAKDPMAESLRAESFQVGLSTSIEELTGIAVVSVSSN